MMHGQKNIKFPGYIYAVSFVILHYFMSDYLFIHLVKGRVL